MSNAATLHKALLEGLATSALLAALTSCESNRNGGADGSADRGQDTAGDTGVTGSIDGPAVETGPMMVDAISSEQTSADTASGDAGVGEDAPGDVPAGICSNNEQKTCATALGSQGACGLDIATCVDGQWTGCSTSKGTDTCDQGNDNNCNGRINENCACIDGAIGSCGNKLAAKGTCATGTTECANGAWGPCSVSAQATDSCAADNDDSCDGQPYTGCQCDGFTMPDPVDSGFPSPQSYTDNGNGTVTDNVTGLVWEQSPHPTDTKCSGRGTATTNFSDVTCTQSESVKYCSDKGSGWRLPTLLELVSLVDYTLPRPGPMINQANFPGTPGEEFWTSSTRIINSQPEAWNVSFGFGNTYAIGPIDDTVLPLEFRRARCVARRSAIGPAPKCYSSRYQPQTGGVVYDAATGLTWQQEFNPTPLDLADATAYCAGLDGGWRLPCVAELQTIVDDTREWRASPDSPAPGPAIDPIAFPGVPIGASFQTSTIMAGLVPDDITGADTVPDVWFINYFFGETSGDIIYGLAYVRCVR